MPSEKLRVLVDGGAPFRNASSWSLSARLGATPRGGGATACATACAAAPAAAGGLRFVAPRPLAVNGALSLVRGYPAGQKDTVGGKNYRGGRYSLHAIPPERMEAEVAGLSEFERPEQAQDVPLPEGSAGRPVVMLNKWKRSYNLPEFSEWVSGEVRRGVQPWRLRQPVTGLPVARWNTNQRRKMAKRLQQTREWREERILRTEYAQRRRERRAAATNEWYFKAMAMGARGEAVDWDTVLQIDRPRWHQRTIEEAWKQDEERLRQRLATEAQEHEQHELRRRELGLPHPDDHTHVPLRRRWRGFSRSDHTTFATNDSPFQIARRRRQQALKRERLGPLLAEAAGGVQAHWEKAKAEFAAK